MRTKWRRLRFRQAVILNPTIELKRGSQYDFVDMKSLVPGSRCATSAVQRVFTGGGSRFAVGDTLMARITPCLENGKIARFCGRIDAVAHGSTEFIVIRGRDGVTRSDFAYYLTKWTEFRDYAISQMTGTSGRQRVPISAFDHFVVPLPPLDEQRTIAHILGTLDDKIELNRRMNETLEEMARALFTSWFVDFDPMRAKAEGRDTGLPPHIAELFPDTFEDSELGQIPRGWRVTELGDHVEVVRGLSYKGSGLSDAGMPMHNLNSIHEGGGYKYEGIKYYTGVFDERHLVKPGDVIVANTEQGHNRLLIGYAAIVPSLYGARGLASHHIYRLRPVNNTPMPPMYVYHLLNSPRMQGLVSGYANGTTVNMLPIDAVQKPYVPVPPRELMMKFSEFARQVQSRQEEMVAESRTLAELRDALLPRLISGEVRIGQIG